MASTAAVLNILVAANTAPASAQLTALSGQLKKTQVQAAATSGTVGGGLSKGSKAAAIGLGAAAVAAVGVGKALSSSVRAASNFESTFAEVRKTVDTNEAGFKRIERGLRNLAKEIPVPVEELNNLAGEAGALGIASKDIITFTRVASQLGTTTNMSSSDAANALARLANIMGTSSNRFENMASALVGLGNAGASTESEIADMALRIASTGKQVGLSEANVLGFASALSSVGINAEAGGSAISKAFSLISRAVATGNEDLAGFAEIADMSAPKFSNLFRRDAARGMLAFIDGLGHIKENGGNALVELDKLGITEVRLTNALLSAAGAGDLFNEQLAMSSKEFRQNSALAEEARKRYETFQQQVQLLKNNFNDLLITVGQKVLPVLKDLVKEVNSVLSDEALTGQEKFAKIFTKLTEVATEAFGKMVEAAVKASPQIASALVMGIVQSNVWARLAAGALLLRALGGRAAIAKIGGFIGLQMGGSMAAGIAAGMSGGAAAGGAAGGLGAAIGGALKNIRWARVGLIGVGIVAADMFMQSMAKRVQAKSPELTEAMRAIIEPGPELLGINLNPIIDGITPSGGGREVAKWIEAAAKAAEKGGATMNAARQAEIKSGMQLLELTKEQKTAVSQLFDLYEAGRDLGIGVNADMNVQELRKIAGGFDFLRENVGSNLADINKVSGETSTRIKSSLGSNSEEGRKLLAKNMRLTADAIEQSMKQSGTRTRVGMKRVRELLADARLVDPTRRQAREIGGVWAQGFANMGKVTSAGVRRVIGEAKKMPGPMRKLAVETMLSQVNAARQAGKITPKEYRTLRSKILAEFTGLSLGTKTRMEGVEKGVRGPAKEAGKRMASLATAAERSSQRIRDAVKSVPNATRGAYTKLANYANSAASAFGSDQRVSLSFRRGGMAKFSGPGLVPAMVSPGELISYKGRELYVPGRPEPRDSVMMNLPPGAKVFTFDGQARLAMGASQNEALRKQAPHFARGGVVGEAPRPKLIGGPAVPRATGQAAIDRGREQASDWVKRLKPTLDMITRIAGGFGLQVTSAYRPGDDGYHGVNRARDYSNSSGPTQEMFKFANYVGTNFGKHLLELIYSPLGWSIKNGSRTAPYAVSDHYDHVHVAMQKGGIVPRLRNVGAPQRLRNGGWVKTGYTVFDDAGGGYLGHLQQGNGYAELGTATQGGSATGVGYIARALGMSGELKDKFPLDVKINGKMRRMYKRDRGYGQGDPYYSIDIYKDTWPFFGLSGYSKGNAWVRRGASKEEIEKVKRGAKNVFKLISSARVNRGADGNLNAARKNAQRGYALAGNGSVDEARERLDLARNQIRKALKNKKPPKKTSRDKETPGGIDIQALRRKVGFLEETIELADEKYGADWSAAGSELDSTERRDLIAKNLQLLKLLRQLRKKVKTAMAFWKTKIPSDKTNIEDSREKVKDLNKKIKGSKDKEKIKGWTEAVKGHEKDIARWQKSVNKGTSTVSDLRTELTDIEGVTTKGGRINDVQMVLKSLNFQAPSESGGPDSELASLLREQLTISQRNLAIAQAQAPIFQQFMPKFHQGGIVQGPRGAERPIMAQAGEGVFTRDQMRAMGGAGNITVVIEDGAIDSNRIRVEVDGVLQDKISTVRRSTPNRRYSTR